MSLRDRALARSPLKVKMMRFRSVLALTALTCLVACSSDDKSADCAAGDDACYRAEVAKQMQSTLLVDIQELHDRATALRDAAPSGHGWDADDDAEAIDRMQRIWVEARAAYERTEGAIAPLFSEIDAAIDERYDGFIEDGQGDADLFDGEGVTGMHAIERILYAPTIPKAVIEIESSLPGYEAAAWPSNAAEADRFKNELCARFEADTAELLNQWSAAKNLDAAGAYTGLVALMNEQREKVVKAASGEEESRYSQRTMTDIRENLAGTRKAYALFKPWLLTKPEGAAIDDDIEQGFDELAATYDEVDGDSIPTPPSSWTAEETPSDEDLDTPFGRLYTAVFDAIDPASSKSIVGSMNRAASVLDLSEFTPE